MAETMAKTAGGQLGGRHLLFGEYFAELGKPKCTPSKINLTLMHVSMF